MGTFFLKLGGSLITDKARREVAREDVIRRTAREIGEALTKNPELSLVLGHGSGSFGHYPAQEHRLAEGIAPGGDWRGYAATAAAAARLNRIVVDILLEEGVRIVSFSPSASALARGGRLVELSWGPIATALERGLVPLVYGDVGFDEVQGACILPTEEVFAYLASPLQAERIILASDVEGIYNGDPQRDPQARLLARISPAEWPRLEKRLHGSPAVDVTGGMLGKARRMVELVQMRPSLLVHFISGERPGAIRGALLDRAYPGGTVLSFS